MKLIYCGDGKMQCQSPVVPLKWFISRFTNWLILPVLQYGKGQSWSLKFNKIIICKIFYLGLCVYHCSTYTMLEFLVNTSECQSLPSLMNGNSSTKVQGIESSLQIWQLIIIMVSIGTFAASIAKLFNYIRKVVYKDKVCAYYYFLFFIHSTHIV